MGRMGHMGLCWFFFRGRSLDSAGLGFYFVVRMIQIDERHLGFTKTEYRFGEQAEAKKIRANTATKKE